MGATDLVWCILEDGPLAGAVYEVSVSARELQISAGGVLVYRRSRWAATAKGHRIVIFRHTKTLVI